MTNTPILNLPLLDAAQSQKILVHNEAIQMLDATFQLNVKSKALSSPPGSPANGDTYIVNGSGSGGWSGLTNDVVGYVNDQWVSFGKKEGWIAWDQNTGRQYVYTSSAWTALDSVVSGFIPRFIATLSADQPIAANTWAKVLYDTEVYDNGVFDNVTNHHFIAPSAGTYIFGATIGWKQTGEVTPTLVRSRFIKNGSTEILARFTSYKLTGTSVYGDELITSINVMCLLAQNDTVEVQQLFLAQASIVPGGISSFWGRKVG